MKRRPIAKRLRYFVDDWRRRAVGWEVRCCCRYDGAERTGDAPLPPERAESSRCAAAVHLRRRRAEQPSEDAKGSERPTERKEASFSAAVHHHHHLHQSYPYSRYHHQHDQYQYHYHYYHHYCYESCHHHHHHDYQQNERTAALQRVGSVLHHHRLSPSSSHPRAWEVAASQGWCCEGETPGLEPVGRRSASPPLIAPPPNPPACSQKHHRWRSPLTSEGHRPPPIPK